MSEILNKNKIVDSQIFKMAPIGMAISNLDGSLIDVNNSFSETIGYSREELLRMNYVDFTHPNDLDENIRRNKSLTKGKTNAYEMEKRFITKVGKVLVAILKVSTLKDEEGKPAYLLAQVLDISDKVELITNIESSEKKFREIFEDAAIPMAQSTLEGEMFNVNKAFAELLEYTRDELEGMKINDISHPNDMSLNKKNTKKLVNKDGLNYSMEKRYLTKSGRTIHAILKVSYIKGVQPDPPHLLGQIVDISSIKNYEKLLESNNAELSKVNTELDSFIYRASHDLRGPLATMKGLVNLIKLNSSEDRTVVDGMSSSIGKLESTIQKLVAFSKNAQAIVDKKEIRLRKVIDESLQVFKYHEHYDLADISINVSNELSFSTDINRIKPIFNNLISNSLTYLNCDKKNCRVAISCYMKDEKLYIEVQDNGEGMDAETKERAFEMFYRGSEKSTGSGLGLYLVNEVVNKLEGNIELESSPDLGTKVIVSLPL